MSPSYRSRPAGSAKSIRALSRIVSDRAIGRSSGRDYGAISATLRHSPNTRSRRFRCTATLVRRRRTLNALYVAA